MGLGFRKNIRFGKHAKLNITHKNVGATIGAKGGSVSAGTGGVRLRGSIPESGIYYEKNMRRSMRRQAIGNLKILYKLTFMVAGMCLIAYWIFSR